MESLPNELLVEVLDRCACPHQLAVAKFVCRRWLMCARRAKVARLCRFWQATAVGCAAYSGDAALAEWARANGCPWSGCHTAGECAAAGGHFALLQWALGSGCPRGDRLCVNAAESGNLEMLKYAQAACGEPWDVWAMVSAARAGHLDTVKWLVEQGCPWTSFVLYDAAEGGHLPVLRWAAEHLFDGELDYDIFCVLAAAQGGHVPVLEWLQAQRVVDSSETGYWIGRPCECAAGGGHLEALRWLRDAGFAWGDGVCAAAARGGHLHVLQWLRDSGCPWSKETCSDAARSGHLEVLQWARRNGCPWDEQTCYRAARAGHLAVLRWARERGCPWDRDQCLDEARDDSFWTPNARVVRWIEEQPLGGTVQ